MEISWKLMVFIFWIIQLSYYKVLAEGKPCTVILGHYFFYNIDYDQCINYLNLTESESMNQSKSICKYSKDQNDLLTINCPYIPDKSWLPVYQLSNPNTPAIFAPHQSEINTNNYGSYSKYWPIKPPICGVSNLSLSYRIVGGNPSEEGAWPWVAALGYYNEITDNLRWLCSGSLISQRHVLTAAHCIYNHPELRVVRLNEYDFDEVEKKVKPRDIMIESHVIHPNFYDRPIENDIALIKLKEEVEFSGNVNIIRPICLPLELDIQETDLIGKEAYVTGWGATFFNGNASTILREVKVPIWSEEECKKAYANIKNVNIDNRNLCAGNILGGKDACQGDSGGSLMYPFGGAFYSIGITSVGFKCAKPNFPGVYTKSTKFLNFILTNMN